MAAPEKPRLTVDPALLLKHAHLEQSGLYPKDVERVQGYLEDGFRMERDGWGNANDRKSRGRAWNDLDTLPTPDFATNPAYGLANNNALLKDAARAVTRGHLSDMLQRSEGMFDALTEAEWKLAKPRFDAYIDSLAALEKAKHTNADYDPKQDKEFHEKVRILRNGLYAPDTKNKRAQIDAALEAQTRENNQAAAHVSQTMEQWKTLNAPLIPQAEKRIEKEWELREKLLNPAQRYTQEGATAADITRDADALLAESREALLANAEKNPEFKQSVDAYLAQETRGMAPDAAYERKKALRAEVATRLSENGQNPASLSAALNGETRNGAERAELEKQYVSLQGSVARGEFYTNPEALRSVAYQAMQNDETKAYMNKLQAQRGESLDVVAGEEQRRATQDSRKEINRQQQEYNAWETKQNSRAEAHNRDVRRQIEETRPGEPLSQPEARALVEDGIMAEHWRRRKQSEFQTKHDALDRSEQYINDRKSSATELYDRAAGENVAYGALADKAANAHGKEAEKQAAAQAKTMSTEQLKAQIAALKPREEELRGKRAHPPLDEFLTIATAAAPPSPTLPGILPPVAVARAETAFVPDVLESNKPPAFVTSVQPPAADKPQQQQEQQNNARKPAETPQQEQAQPQKNWFAALVEMILTAIGFIPQETQDQQAAAAPQNAATPAATRQRNAEALNQAGMQAGLANLPEAERTAVLDLPPDVLAGALAIGKMAKTTNMTNVAIAAVGVIPGGNALADAMGIKPPEPETARGATPAR